MTKIERVIASVAIVAFGMSSVAQAAPVPMASAEVVKASASGRPAATAWVDPPRAQAPGKSAAAAPVEPPAQVAETQERKAKDVAKDVPAAPRPLPAPRAPAAVAKADTVQDAPAKPRSSRSAKFSGGNGNAWKSGRDLYSFMGSFGGCRYSGYAGPGGYKINRVC